MVLAKLSIPLEVSVKQGDLMTKAFLFFLQDQFKILAVIRSKLKAKNSKTLI